MAGRTAEIAEIIITICLEIHSTIPTALIVVDQDTKRVTASN